MNNNTGSAYDRVKRGAKLLDEAMPGWAQRINLDLLSLESVSRCVLGQLFAKESVSVERWKASGYSSLDAYCVMNPGATDGTDVICIANYHAGRHVLGLDDTQSQYNGFTLLPSRDHDGGPTWDDLDECWGKEVEARQFDASL